MEELKLPELGEDIDVVDVAGVLVAVGETIERDQSVIEVETEKASLEVPSEVAGVVTELLVGKGDKLKVGQVILRLEPSGATATASPEKASAPPAPSVAEADAASSVPPAAARAVAAQPRPVVVPSPAGPGQPGRESTAPAAPSARALARQLGVIINEVAGSGPGGRISREDVKAHAKRIIQAAASGTAAAAAPPLPDFAQWGEIETEPLSALRRAAATHLARAWVTVPHVTQFDRADITELESMRKRFNRRENAGGRKLSMTAIVIKTVAAALRQFPKFNASLDPANDVVIYKKYTHIGVAVDTERGLVVPVIRDVHDKNLLDVTEELGELARRARDKKVSPDQMRGATFTVSNLGGLGTTYFSPIVNWPEVGILGVGRAEPQAVLSNGKFEPRLIMPLSISYDHRWIDGADAARFARWIAEALEQPLLLLVDD